MTTRSQVVRFVSVFALLLLIAGSAIGLFPGGVSTAAPAAEPLPPAPRVVTLKNTAVTTSFNTSTIYWNDPAAHINHTTPTEAEIFWHIVMPTVNTTTFTLYTSVDGTNWASMGALASNVVTNTDSYTTVNTVGRFFRISATCSTTPTFTPTIYAVLKRDDIQ